jgi:hypothetical protein
MSGNVQARAGNYLVGKYVSSIILESQANGGILGP